MTRTVFHVVPSNGQWGIKQGGNIQGLHATQAAAEAAAIAQAKRIEAGGGLAQVVFHRADGTIREEHTYGKDPERYKG